MQQQPFTIPIHFKGTIHTANVDVLDNGSHIQYTIWPSDRELESRFGTQVVHAFPNQPMALAFPGEGPDASQYNKAVLKALESALTAASK